MCSVVLTCKNLRYCICLWCCKNGSWRPLEMRRTCISRRRQPWRRWMQMLINTRRLMNCCRRSMWTSSRLRCCANRCQRNVPSCLHDSVASGSSPSYVGSLCWPGAWFTRYLRGVVTALKSVRAEQVKRPERKQNRTVPRCGSVCLYA